MGRDYALEVADWSEIWECLQNGQDADLTEKLGVDGEYGEDVADSLTDAEWISIYQAVCDKRDAIRAGLYGRDRRAKELLAQLCRILTTLAEFSEEGEVKGTGTEFRKAS